MEGSKNIYPMKNYWFILIIFFIACSSRSDFETRFDREVKTFLINDFDLISVESTKTYFEEIIRPAHITNTSNYLIVSDRASKNHLHLIHKNKLGYLGSFGGRGDGPEEFLSVSGFKRSVDDNQFILFSTNDKKIVKYILADDIAKHEVNALVPDSTYRLTDINTEITYFDFLSDNRIISKERTSQHKFIEYKLGLTKPVQLYDTWDGMLGTKDIPNSVTASVFQGDVVVNPKGNYFGHATIFWDLIELRNVDTGEWLRLVGPDKLEHKFEIDASLGYPMHSWEAEDNRIGFVSLYLGTSQIFALYSGMPARGAHGKKVFIFDYQGTPIRAYELDVAAYRMTIDEKNKMVYVTFTEKEQAGIASFSFNIN